MSSSKAQDPAERFDVVAIDGQATGIVKTRAAVHRDGDWHRSVHVWIAGEDDHGSFITFQRRSLAKDTWGGKLDATVGGHFRAGETLTETLREVEEEIGVPVDEMALIPLGMRICVSDIEPDVQDHELQSIFLWLDNRPLLEFAPNPDELSALVRFRIDSLLAFFADSAMTVEGLSRTPGACSTERIVVRQRDFIEQADRYPCRIAMVASRAIEGETQLAI